jgi:ankyrin repeat protein
MKIFMVTIGKLLVLLLCLYGWAGAQSDGNIFVQGRIKSNANGLVITSDSDHSVLRIENPEIFENPEDHRVVLHGILKKDSIRAISAATIDNATDPLGTALVEMASYRQDPDMVLHLLQLGANPDSKGPNGNSALMESIETGIMRWGASPSLEITTLLLDHKADPNLPNNIGRTPLMSAAFSGNDEVVSLLLAHHAKVNANDKHGRTPLMNAPTGSVVKILVGAGASLEDADDSGNTALRYAAGRGNYEVVKALVETGANVNTKDKRGVSALAKAKERLETIKKYGRSSSPHSYESRYQRVVDILTAAGAI